MSDSNTVKKVPYGIRYVERQELAPDGYANLDWDVVDYKMYRMNGVHVHLRGPITWDGCSDYVTFIGAAQTFGRYCKASFPDLVGNGLSIPYINFGHAGAGPALFVRNPILYYLNNSRAVVVQVMSGRSVSNSLFENPNATGLLRRRDLPDEQLCPWDKAWQRGLDDYGPQFIADLVQETRAIYIAQMRMLLSSIKVPKILFWFSKRRPEYADDYNHIGGFFGGFPQMINRRVINELLPYCDKYVEVVSSRGVPQKLFNRFDGSIFKIASEPEDRCTVDHYYPSPEMHEDAARELKSAVKEFYDLAR